MTFDIWLFGAIEIRHDGALLTGFRSQKALILLAYLLCEELYRAPFLQGIYVDDAPELERWLWREQEHWQGR